jgi:hypothetical protein
VDGWLYGSAGPVALPFPLCDWAPLSSYPPSSLTPPAVV